MSKNQELIDYFYREKFSSYFIGKSAFWIVKENRVRIDMDTFDALKNMGVLESAVNVRMPYDLDVFMKLMKYPDIVPPLIRNATNFPVVIVRDIIDVFLDDHIPMTGDYDMSKVRDVLFMQRSFSYIFTSKMVKKLNFDEDTKCLLLQRLVDSGVYIHGCVPLCPKEYPKSAAADNVLYTLMRSVSKANVRDLGYEYILSHLITKWNGVPQDILEQVLFLHRVSPRLNILEHCIIHLCDIYKEDRLLNEIFNSKHALIWIRKAAPRLSIESITHVAKDSRLARVRAVAADEIIKRGVSVGPDMVNAGMRSSSVTENRVWKAIAKHNIDKILNTETTNTDTDDYIHSL